MTNTSKLFVAIGCVLLLAAAFLRLTTLQIVIAASSLKPSSFVILANTSFLLAILSKK